jgi:hypothetical protein
MIFYVSVFQLLGLQGIFLGIFIYKEVVPISESYDYHCKD